jgi:predicted ABC-type ATPase
MSKKELEEQPLLFVFAGPNGSGKTTIKRALHDLPDNYINADDIKVQHGLSDLEAAQEAERQRKEALNGMHSFSFETVLSTERNLLLMQQAKQLGYFVQCIYVLTCNANINVARVKARNFSGGHDVPEDKIRSRYERALKLLPQVIPVCDWIAIYDNSTTPTPIFLKDGTSMQIFPCEDWSEHQITKLLFPESSGAE